MDNIADVGALAALHATRRAPPKELVAKLRKPYVDRSTGERKEVALDYVGHADVTDMLLESDPLWGWEPFAVDASGLPLFVVDVGGSQVGLWIRLTIHGLTRIGYGSCPPGKPEATKELIGDAVRNAAMRFGVCLLLWSKAPGARS